MKCAILLLLACSSFATPSAAQSSNDALQPVLVRWGFPAQALTVFFGTEADARRVLGAPSREQRYQNEFHGGPDFRQLEYRLSGGRLLILRVCTDHERRGRGIRRPQVFCEMTLAPSSGAVLPAHSHEVLLPIADGKFGQCDTTYYRFDGLTVSL